MVPTNPFFSIILVVYNGANTITLSIDSVVQQEFTNYELIIIDGGSRDGTIDRIKQFGEKINYFISEPDQGIYDAMNKGIAAAKGEYLYFLGSDDTLFNENTLQEVAASLHQHPADFIYGNVIMSASGKLYDGAFTYPKLLTKNISHQAIFYKRSVFIQMGDYNTRFKLHADWDFNLSCFKNDTIQKTFIQLTIANFTEGSSSSKPDKLFIKEGLLPAILQYNAEHPGFLVSLINFDFVWRQLRNAGINQATDITSFDAQQAPYIVLMIRFQSMAGTRLIKTGIVSKSIMMLCFLYCKLNRAL